MRADARRASLIFALRDGPWDLTSVHARVSEALSGPGETIEALCATLLARWPSRPSEQELVRGLTREAPNDDDDDPRLVATLAARLVAAPGRPAVRRFHLPPLEPLSLASFAPGLPSLATEAEAAALVGMPARDLPFFTDDALRGGRPLSASLAHYRYRWIAKKSGGARLVEAPKPRLRAMQRALHDRVLSLVPLHDAAHAFTRGRSARTFAAVHVGAAVVVRLDLEDFFASIGIARIEAIFRALGYPDAVARTFAMLATHRTPRAVLRARPSPAPDDASIARGHRAAKRLASPHLPQGAPSSPRLASLAAFALDVRLTALARTFDARYARYADDLAFSGHGSLDGLVRVVTEIARDEGFLVRRDKTRIMRAHARQELAGLVVNHTPDVTRDRYDRLRARLHHLARGRDVPGDVDARIRLLHELEGHVAWASARPHRAEKLGRLLTAARAVLMG